MLSELHSYFDPIRFTLPFLLKCELIYQMCLIQFLTVSWIDPLPPEIFGKGKYFIRQLLHLRNLEIPHWLIGLTKESTVTRHVFCDALAFVYSAMGYITIQPAKTTSLVITKSRAVPHTAEMWSILCKELIGVIEGSLIVKLLP